MTSPYIIWLKNRANIEENRKESDKLRSRIDLV